MKKFQMSLTALAVIIGAAGAVAFKAAPKAAHKVNKNFKYNGTFQTKASYNLRTNYSVTTSAGCSTATRLCIITNVAATALGARPALPAGYGTALANYNSQGTISVQPATIGGVSVTFQH